MSDYFSPYDADRPPRLRCSCGQDHSVEEHAAQTQAAQAVETLQQRSASFDVEDYSRQFLEASLVKALFPQDNERRRFLRAVGKNTAMAAIASVLPG